MVWHRQQLGIMMSAVLSSPPVAALSRTRVFRGRARQCATTRARLDRCGQAQRVSAFATALVAVAALALLCTPCGAYVVHDPAAESGMVNSEHSVGVVHAYDVLAPMSVHRGWFGSKQLLAALLASS